MSTRSNIPTVQSNQLLTTLSKFQELRGNPIILYRGAINNCTYILHHYLRGIEKIARLDFVLSSKGGNIISARQMLLLLREYTEHLTVIVPRHAWSAGTMFCLGADELLLSPISELTPIDVQISRSSLLPPNGPDMISSEDLRLFHKMAEEWFDIDGEEAKIRVFSIVAQHFFPTTLTTLFRNDRLTRNIARELLKFQLPQASDELLREVVEQLIEHYFNHEFVLTRNDIEGLGLNSVRPTLDEELIMNDLEHKSSALITADLANAESIQCVIASTDFLACEVFRWQNSHNGTEDGLENGDSRKDFASFWKIRSKGEEYELNL